MHYLSSADFFTSNVLNNPLHKTSVVGKTLAGVDINYINEKKIESKHINIKTIANITIHIYYVVIENINLLSANPIKWSNTLKQFFGF